MNTSRGMKLEVHSSCTQHRYTDEVVLYRMVIIIIIIIITDDV